MDTPTAAVLSSAIAAVPATIAAVLTYKTHAQVSRNGNRNPDKPTLPDRVGNVGDKVDTVDGKFDDLTAVVLEMRAEQQSQGAQIRALWRHVRHQNDPTD